MKIIMADESDEFGIKHDKHNEHFCTILKFENSDRNFWKHDGFYTWMPRDIEVYALVKAMIGISPRFRALFFSEFDFKKQQVEEKSESRLGVLPLTPSSSSEEISGSSIPAANNKSEVKNE